MSSPTLLYYSIIQRFFAVQFKSIRQVQSIYSIELKNDFRFNLLVFTSTYRKFTMSYLLEPKSNDTLLLTNTVFSFNFTIAFVFSQLT